jgi:DNA-binding NarL/FixJ family response regulator
VSDQDFATDHLRVLDFSKLTRRRREAIALKCAGLSIKDIAKLMFCEPDSVKEHLRLAYEDLGVKGSRYPSGLVCYSLGVLHESERNINAPDQVSDQ